MIQFCFSLVKMGHSKVIECPRKHAKSQDKVQTMHKIYFFKIFDTREAFLKDVKSCTKKNLVQ